MANKAIDMEKLKEDSAALRTLRPKKANYDEDKVKVPRSKVTETEDDTDNDDEMEIPRATTVATIEKYQDGLYESSIAARNKYAESMIGRMQEFLNAKNDKVITPNECLMAICRIAKEHQEREMKWFEEQLK